MSLDKCIHPRNPPPLDDRSLSTLPRNSPCTANNVLISMLIYKDGLFSIFILRETDSEFPLVSGFFYVLGIYKYCCEFW